MAPGDREPQQSTAIDTKKQRGLLLRSTKIDSEHEDQFGDRQWSKRTFEVLRASLWRDRLLHADGHEESNVLTNEWVSAWWSAVREYRPTDKKKTIRESVPDQQPKNLNDKSTVSVHRQQKNTKDPWECTGLHKEEEEECEDPWECTGSTARQ